jgi:hypothetical protein
MADEIPFPIPKAEWGKGAWQTEPDRLEFEHLGFTCLIRRNMMHGHLCGYVAVPPGHPWHGATPDEIDADVHGSLNYGSPCNGDICHVPKPGEPADVYWLGFDCGHGGIDSSPAMDALMEKVLPEHLRPSALASTYRRAGFMIPTYKTVAFVHAQCEMLAEQAQSAQQH